MSIQDNEQAIGGMSPEKKRFVNSGRIWIFSILALVVLAAAVVSYYVWNVWKQDEMQRQLQEQQRQIELQEQQALYEAALKEVKIEAFYEGISIDGLDISGMTRDEARALLLADKQKKYEELLFEVSLDDQQWQINAYDLKLEYDTETALDEAWKLGRISSATDERSQIFERQQKIRELAENPVDLSTSYTYDEQYLKDYLTEVAESLYLDPQPTVATGFDVASRKFILSEAHSGREVSPDKTIESIRLSIEKGVLQDNLKFDAREILPPESDLAVQAANLKLISQSTTYAKAIDPPRDKNISLVVKRLNGYVIQPGEEFSFNRVVGERTAAKGYQAAGSILDGVLIKTLGGGICQPNTTLYQSVLKADLEIVARRPHQFPSSYTEVGLDATVSWGGSDLKFINNTAYPIAIVCWYDKPELTFQLYGRPLPDGMSIKLTAETIENTSPGAPIERLNEELAPGSRVQVRSAHNLKRARSYKVWYKDGAVVKTELADTSYYPPIKAIFEYGPPLPSPAPVPEQEAPVEAPAEEPAELPAEAVA
jgi:vancomycin resistance protein YoaR